MEVQIQPNIDIQNKEKPVYGFISCQEFLKDLRNSTQNIKRAQIRIITTENQNQNLKIEIKQKLGFECNLSEKPQKTQKNDHSPSPISPSSKGFSSSLKQENQFFQQQSQNEFSKKNLIKQSQNSTRLYSDNFLQSFKFQILQDNKERQQRKLKQSKQTNDRKDIPKNFSRGIFQYIIKNFDNVKEIFGKENFNELEDLQIIQLLKKNTTSIKNLRQLWSPKYDMQSLNLKSKKISKYKLNKLEQSFEKKISVYKKMLRIMTYRFLKHESIVYFYNNKRIKKHSCLLKYRQILLKIIQDPDHFYSLKIE